MSVESPQQRLDAAGRRYEKWTDRGDERGGRRLTIMTATTEVVPGETVEVDHVVEALGPEHQLYVMGPKPVHGEQVDGSPSRNREPAADSLAPGDYDGVTVPGPGIDANFEVTTYSFDEPGEHDIVWETGGLRSNVLRIRVKR